MCVVPYRGMASPCLLSAVVLGSWQIGLLAQVKAPRCTACCLVSPHAWLLSVCQAHVRCIAVAVAVGNTCCGPKS
jgi:hypothetical protein